MQSLVPCDLIFDMRLQHRSWQGESRVVFVVDRTDCLFLRIIPVPVRPRSRSILRDPNCETGVIIFARCNRRLFGMRLPDPIARAPQAGFANRQPVFLRAIVQLEIDLKSLARGNNGECMLLIRRSGCWFRSGHACLQRQIQRQAPRDFRLLPLFPKDLQNRILTLFTDRERL